jgi:hypothetical protein
MFVPGTEVLLIIGGGSDVGDAILVTPDPILEIVPFCGILDNKAADEIDGVVIF